MKEEQLSKLHQAFDQAVSDLRQDFPRETASVTFVNAAAPDAFSQVSNWVLNAPRMIRACYLLNTSLQDFTHDVLSHEGSCLHSLKRALVTINPSIENTPLLRDRAKDTYFSVVHEFGHVILDKPPLIPLRFKAVDHLYSTNQKENGADSFAAMYMRKKGLLDNRELAQISDQRAIGAWLHQDWYHFTSPSLDQIIINKENIDFVSLTPREVKAIASQHAKLHRPQKQELSDARYIFDVEEPTNCFIEESVEMLYQAAPSSLAYSVMAHTYNALFKKEANFLQDSFNQFQNPAWVEHQIFMLATAHSLHMQEAMADFATRKPYQERINNYIKSQSAGGGPKLK